MLRGPGSAIRAVISQRPLGCAAAWALAGLFLSGPKIALAGAQWPALAPEVASRLADVLAGRRVAVDGLAPGPVGIRGELLRLLYRQTVGAAPLILTAKRPGTGAVIHKDATVALVVTNHHVVDKPFLNDKGEPYVLLVFHQPSLTHALAGRLFERHEAADCLGGDRSDAWCLALRKSVRHAAILKVDARRDLALLRVTDPPSELTPIAFTNLAAVEPGDDVAVIGHPIGFLWSLSTGIVTALRTNYPLTAKRDTLGTMVQTQAPFSEGNGGGPLMTLKGHLLGIMTWSWEGGQNLNVAIAVNEVQSFADPEIKALGR